MIKQQVGERIKKLRMNQNLSQEKLALKANIDRTYIASVESGKRNVSIVTLEKIIHSLNVTFSEFFKGM